MRIESLEPRCMLDGVAGAVTGDLFYLAGSSGTQLVATAPASPTVNCGTAGTLAFMDLASDSNGQLYGVANRTDGSSNADLYTINPATGAASWVQSIAGYRDVNALEVANGTIYAAHSSGVLMQLTGSSWVQVGTLNGSQGDLAYQASTNRLYYIDNSTQLEYYDLAQGENGTSQLVGPVGHGAIYAMDFSANGTLYAVSSQSTDPVLLSLNLSTGVGTVQQTYTGLGQVWGLAAEAATIEVTPSRVSGLMTTESGGTDTFTLTLASQPLANVSVGLSIDDTTEGSVSPASVVFTSSNWETPQTVTVTGLPDSQSDGDTLYHVVTGNAVSSDARYNNLVVSDISVTNVDIDPPVVAFAMASQSAAESVGGLAVTVRLIGAAPATDVTVPFTVSGKATRDSDYSISSSPLTIGAGETSGTITINVIDDTADESNETVVVTLGTPTGAGLGTLTTYTLTIVDNDATPTVQFTTATQAAAENGGTIVITAQLSGLSGDPVTVPFTVAGTATANTDYWITSSPLTILAGQTTGTITVSLNNDTLHEEAETIVVTMGTPTGATLGATASQTVTIVDDDPAPTVQFTAASQSHPESFGTVTATVELSAASALPVTVPFTVTGTATAGTDYTITPSPLTIPAGQTTGSVTINVIDDTAFEYNESVAITLGTPTGATLGAQKIHTTLIENNDPLPAVSFASASEIAPENTGSMTVIVELSAPSVLPISVPFAATGTATGGGVDYSISASPLMIPAGQSTATITITMVDDALYESNESVILTMSPPTNASLGSLVTHTATIADNELAPAVNFTRDSQASWESVGAFTITAQLSAVSGLPVTLPFTTAGTASGNLDDYSITASPITIPAGQTTGTITINVINDPRYEYDETVVVTMGTPVGATLGDTTTHTATILNDDPKPTVQFISDSQTGPEGTTFVITAQLSILSGVPVSVPYTVSGTAGAGTDYTIDAGPINIPAGESAATIVLRALDDSLHENNESVVVSLDTPSGANLGPMSTHTVTITDNDPPPSVQFTAATASVAESDGLVTIGVELSAVSGLPVTLPFTVSGTATGTGKDYSIFTSPLTIPAGQSTGTINVLLAPDTIDEPDETIVVTLGTPTEATLGTTTTTTLSIVNAPVAQLTAASQSGPESGTMTVTVQLSAPSTLPITLPFTLTGTAETGVDYAISPAGAITIPPGATTASVTIDVANDNLYEHNEAIVLALDKPTNAFLGSQTTHTATIQNDDPPPVVALTTSGQAVCESDGSVTVTAQLSAVSGVPVVLPFTLTGTATGNGTDYTVSANPLVIPAGEIRGTITLALTPDLIDEPDETVLLSLGTPTDATLGAQTTCAVTIINAPVVQFTAASQNAPENAGTLTIIAQLSTVSSLPITLPFTVAGTAQSGPDYWISPGPITIPAGQLSGSITISVTDDPRYEADETVVVTLDTPVNAVWGAKTTHALTILNNDSPPVVQLAATSASPFEYVGPVTVMVRLSEVSGLPVTVPFTVTGTATDGADYTIGASPLTIPAGELTGTITINVIEDALDERNETAVVTLGTPTDATLGATQTYTLTIVDNDPMPSVQFTAASQSAAENAGTMTVTVQLSAASGLPVTIPFTVSGTASAGADYTIAASPLTIPAGETTATITINLVGDGLPEPDETVIVTLGTPVNATAGSLAQHTATITGDGSQPSTIGLFAPASSFFHLRCSNTSGPADYTFGYGEANGGWIVLTGDWNGDGVTGVGLYAPNSSTFYLTNAYQTGIAEYTFGYGEAGGGWIPLVGDWNGDGKAGVGLYDPKSSTFYLTDTLQTGYAEHTFGYGEPGGGWTPLVGDWNGDGHSGVGLYNPHASTFYLTSTLQTGYAEHTFGYGEPDAGWKPLVGDWNGDRSDGVGLFASESSTFYLTSAFVSGFAQYAFGYGEPNGGWKPLVGDWNGDRSTGVGLYAPSSSTFYLTDTLSSGYAEHTVGFGQPGAGWQPLVGSWGAAPSAAPVAAAPAAWAAPAPKAVDQIDLASLAAGQLSHTADLQNSSLDSLGAPGVNATDWLMAHGI